MIEQKIDELVAAMDRLTGAMTSKTIVAEVTPEPEVGETPTPTVVDTAPTEPTPITEPVPSPDALADALKRMATTKGMPVIMELLSPFGAMRVSEIPVERHAELAAAIRKAGGTF